MRIFRQYCPSTASNYISYMETRFSAAARLYIPQEHTSRLCNRWDFNPSRMYLLQRQKRDRIPEANVRLVFRDDEPRPLSARREACVHSLRDRALHYANASSNWRGATDTGQVFKHHVSKYARQSRFQSLSRSKLLKNATLFDPM